MPEFCEMSSADLVQSHPYFNQYESEVKHEISPKCHRIAGLHEGSRVFDVNGLPQCFVLVAGVIELSSRRRGLSGYVGAGAVLGDDALLTGAYQYSATACTPCHLLVLGDWYRSLARKYPEVQSNIIRRSQLRQGAVEDFYQKLLRASKPGRIAVILQNIAQAIEQPQIVEDHMTGLPASIEWLNSQEKIGELAMVSRAKVHEALSVLYKLGAIDFSEWKGRKNALPLILREGCTHKLERALEVI